MQFKTLLPWLALTAVALLFFVMMPSIPYGDTLPRAVFFFATLLLLGGAWVLAYLQGDVSLKRLLHPKESMVAWASVAVAAVMLVVAFFQPNPLRHIIGDASEAVGVWSLALLALFIAVARTAFTNKDWRLVRRGLLALFGLTALVGVGDAFGLWGGSTTQLPFSHAGDLLTAMAVGAGMTVWSWRRRDVRPALAIVLLGIIAVTGVFAGLSFAQETATERAMLTPAAMEAFQQRMWTGWGAAGLQEALYNGFDAQTMVPDGVHTLPIFTTPYRGFLSVLLWGGIFGALVTAALLAAVLYSAWQRREYVLGGTLAGISVFVVGWGALNVVVLGLLALLVAAIAWRDDQPERIEPHHNISILPAGAILAAAVLVVLWFTAVTPLQTAARIAAVGEEGITSETIAAVRSRLDPTCQCIGGHDLRLSFAEQVIDTQPRTTEEGRAGVDVAITEIEKAVRDAPRDPLALWRHQQLLNKRLAFTVQDKTGTRLQEEERVRGVMNEGRAVYDQAIALTPNHPEPYIQRGILSFVRGFYLQADHDFFSRALDVMPGNARARWMRGNAREQYGFWAGARGDLLGAVDDVEYDYRNPRDLQYLVDALSANNDQKNAVRFAREWIELFPTDANAYASYAQLLQEMGEEERAFQQLQKAFQLDPSLRDRFLDEEGAGE